MRQTTYQEQVSSMSKYQEYLDRADNCAELAAEAMTIPAKKRYLRMEAAWRALADEELWLDGKISPQCLKREHSRSRI
jgi:hypothetical protein